MANRRGGSLFFSPGGHWRAKDLHAGGTDDHFVTRWDEQHRGLDLMLIGELAQLPG